MDLKIYSISDKYIQYLRSFKQLNSVFDNKEHNRTHMRKYLGAVFEKNGNNYYIPFSSPKASDYEKDNRNNFVFNSDGSKKIKKSIIPIIRMTHIDSNNKLQLLGTLKINNMIPVPKEELIDYDIDNEKDIPYKNLVINELEFIRKNAKLILRNADVIYRQKANEARLSNAPGYLKQTVDFLFAEEKCKEYCRQLTAHDISDDFGNEYDDEYDEDFEM